MNGRLLSPVEALKLGFNKKVRRHTDGTLIVESLREDVLVPSISDTVFQENSVSVSLHSMVEHSHHETSLNDTSLELTEKRQGFRVGNINLMVRYEDGNQLSELPEIYPLPNSPTWFCGMSNLNGQMIPVFDLKNILASSSNEIEKTPEQELLSNTRNMLFVLEHHENATGLIIEGFLERLDFSESQLQVQQLAPKNLTESITAIYLIKNELWYELDSLRFLQFLENLLENYFPV